MRGDGAEVDGRSGGKGGCGVDVLHERRLKKQNFKNGKEKRISANMLMLESNKQETVGGTGLSKRTLEGNSSAHTHRHVHLHIFKNHKSKNL